MNLTTLKLIVDILAPFLTILSILAGVYIVSLQIYTKRADDNFNAQLKRLNDQLSKLYGPLYALYRTGDEQWRKFIAKYSNHPNAKHPRFPHLGFFPDKDHPFTPPDAEKLAIFRLWTESVFLITNTRMEEVIINSAELLVGSEMPLPFLEFCVHMASFRASVADWQTDPNFKLDDDWERHMALFEHPAERLDVYIKASFTVLKKKQSEVLLADEVRKQKGYWRFFGKQSTISINEQELEKQIKEEMERLREMDRRDWEAFLREGS